MTGAPRWTPATDEDLSQYAVDCASAGVDKCNACFVGPAMAQCSSFLCMRDVGKLLARLQILRAERDELEQRWRKAARELAASNEQLEKLTRGAAPGRK